MFSRENYGFEQISNKSGFPSISDNTQYLRTDFGPFRGPEQSESHDFLKDKFHILIVKKSNITKQRGRP